MFVHVSSHCFQCKIHTSPVKKFAEQKEVSHGSSTITCRVSLATIDKNSHSSHIYGILMYICIYYIYIWYSYWAKVFRFHVESWPEWESNPWPRAYCVHALTTELSGWMMRCAEWSTGSSGHEDQVIARWLQWPSLNHIRS